MSPRRSGSRKVRRGGEVEGREGGGTREEGVSERVSEMCEGIGHTRGSAWSCVRGGAESSGQTPGEHQGSYLDEALLQRVTGGYVSALGAFNAIDPPVQINTLLLPCRAVQPVHVLRDQSTAHHPACLQRSERQVGRVGPGAREVREAHERARPVPLPRAHRSRELGVKHRLVPL